MTQSFVTVRGAPKSTGLLRQGQGSSTPTLPPRLIPVEFKQSGIAPESPYSVTSGEYQKFFGSDFGDDFAPAPAKSPAKTDKGENSEAYKALLAEYEGLKGRINDEYAMAERIKDRYINEGESYVGEANSRAQGIIDKAQKEISEMYQTEREAMSIERAQIYGEAMHDGYEKGLKKGREEGYAESFEHGKQMCEDTLDELMAVLAEISATKEAIFHAHEKKLFDLIFTVANKVTEDSLKQKEKAVITKMLKAAAKNFRTSEYVKVTLSKLDVEAMGTADFDTLRECFPAGKNIEFDIQSEEPSGTVILDDGRDTRISSTSLQLEMIEKLGKGKFRDRPQRIAADDAT